MFPINSNLHNDSLGIALRRTFLAVRGCLESFSDESFDVTAGPNVSDAAQLRELAHRFVIRVNAAILDMKPIITSRILGNNLDMNESK